MLCSSTTTLTWRLPSTPNINCLPYNTLCVLISHASTGSTAADTICLTCSQSVQGILYYSYRIAAVTSTILWLQYSMNAYSTYNS